MACNCATEEQIKELYRQFGVKSAKPKNMTFPKKVLFYIKKVAMAIILTLIAPLLFIYVFYVGFFGSGKISFTKFFGLKPINLDDYVRKQQELQNKNKGR